MRGVCLVQKSAEGIPIPLVPNSGRGELLEKFGVEQGSRVPHLRYLRLLQDATRCYKASVFKCIKTSIGFLKHALLLPHDGSVA